MARIPTVLAVSLSAALVLAACGGATASGNTLVYGLNGEPDNLDPHASLLDVTGLFTRPVLNSLAQILPYTGTTVVDPYTAKVTLSQLLSPFLAALATAYLGIESPRRRW
jgi:ABC-type oligopeptide transport system substrate-binding subunit